MAALSVRWLEFLRTSTDLHGFALFRLGTTETKRPRFEFLFWIAAQDGINRIDQAVDRADKASLFDVTHWGSNLPFLSEWKRHAMTISLPHPRACHRVVTVQAVLLKSHGSAPLWHHSLNDASQGWNVIFRRVRIGQWAFL
jgi:hypothetical protein